MTGLILIKPLESLGYIALNGSEHDNERLLTENYLRITRVEYGSVGDEDEAHPYIGHANKKEFLHEAAMAGFQVQEIV